jgi:DHA2 family multidrug resistance protein
VTPYDAGSQAAIAGLRGTFLSTGSDTVTATNRAYAAMSGMIQRQAAMVSFVGLFQLLAVMFFVLLPLILLMKKPRTSAPPPGAH